MIISPNPASDKAILTINSYTAAEAVINVFDMSGKLVHRQTNMIQNGTNHIDLPFVNRGESGMYFIQVNIHGESITEKLIINK